MLRPKSKLINNHNITSKIFNRQIHTPRPATSVHCGRLFYENVVPSCTIYDVECPDYSFRKFTEDGRYLITYSRNHQDVVVYRPSWLSYSCKGDCEYIDSQDSNNNTVLPSKAKKFESFFTQLFSTPLASADEYVSKDFFVYVPSKQYGLFATSTNQIHDAPPPSATPEGVGAPLQGIPYVEKITFYLLRLEDGVVLDERAFHNDYLNLSPNTCACLYDDLLAIVSLRYQRIHIIQIRDSGSLVEVRAIGDFCNEDDQLFLNSNPQVTVNHGGSAPDDSQSVSHGSFLTGIKQRLLSFIVRRISAEETDPVRRMQCLKKKFYFHFQDYVDLMIWKVQFLDRHHLFIKFGSVDGGMSRNADHHPAFFVVYNMETTEIVAFYQNSAEDLYLLFEHFGDHFLAASNSSLHMNFISSHANNIHASEQLRGSRNKANSFSQFVKKILASLPFSCQSQNPSPYYDQSLFRYDEKLISSTERHRQATDHPIKFIARRPPYALKFKIKPGLEAGSTDNRTKKICSFLFHPVLPLAISIHQTLFMQQAVVNIHFRG